MTYQVLYRVWRPQDFQELAGQEHIRRTLENAILQDRISHAYLFTGPRGTGKTSTARILAKALNCSRRQGTQPCGSCESCRSIALGHSLDVLEIDGASNRGIEEIRELKEKIGFLPALGKYKVYIVDEVHMLTTEAFNALLKTLEEPPAHVIFVLATTDPQKLPPTVLSRCQRFDFRKLTPEAIKDRLEEIVAGQGTTVAPDALAMIIRQADGGLRDAISLLDQCLSFSPEGVDLDSACRILGLVRREALAELLSAVIDQAPTQLFTRLAALFDQGVEPAQLLKELAGYGRDLLLLALCGEETDLVTVGWEERSSMCSQARQLGAVRLQQLVAQVDQAASGGRYRGNSRYMAEAFFAGLLLGPAASTGIGGGKAMPGAGAGLAVQAPPAGHTGPAAPAKRGLGQADVKPPLDHVDHEAAKAAKGTKGVKAPRGADKTAAVPPEAPGESVMALDGAAVIPAVPAASQRGSLSATAWEEILQRIKSQKIVLHAFLLAALEQELTEDSLLIRFDPEKGRFHKERCQEAENLKLLAEVAGQVLGQAINVQCDYIAKDSAADPVEKARALFGPEIVKIEDE